MCIEESRRFNITWVQSYSTMEMHFDFGFVDHTSWCSGLLALLWNYSCLFWGSYGMPGTEYGLVCVHGKNIPPAPIIAIIFFQVLL